MPSRESRRHHHGSQTGRDENSRGSSRIDAGNADNTKVTFNTNGCSLLTQQNTVHKLLKQNHTIMTLARVHVSQIKTVSVEELKMKDAFVCWCGHNSKPSALQATESVGVCVKGVDGWMDRHLFWSCLTSLLYDT